MSPSVAEKGVGSSGSGINFEPNLPNQPYPLQKITTYGASNPTVSPDGQWMVCTNAAGYLVRIPIGGGAPTPLGVKASSSDWSRTGNQVAFVDDLQRLCTINPFTLHITVLNNGPFVDWPTWSPNSDFVAVNRTGGIDLVSYPGGVRDSLPCTDPVYGGACAGENPSWSPDVDWLSFQNNDGILRQNPGSGAVGVVLSGLGDVVEPSWSPDGQWVAFARKDKLLPGHTHENYHLWVFDVSGLERGLTMITTTDATCTSDPTNDLAPHWSPDSRSIYFSSNRGGTTNIWKASFNTTTPGGTVTQLPVTVATPSKYDNRSTPTGRNHTGSGN
jgi:Tol biopolymer transport system component